MSTHRTHHEFTARTLRVAVALTLVSATATACGGDADAKEIATATTPAVPVDVAVVTSAAVSDPISATGTYTSRDEIPLSFKIGGVIAAVHVDQGATVRKGQLLASLDLREIDAMVLKAQVGVEKAERDAARIQRLQRDSVATLAQLQDALSARDAARADLASARVNREYAIIVAPQSGVVLQRQAAAGTTIGAGGAVLTLGGGTRGRVLRVGLPDRDALRVRVGDDAPVRFDALPEKSFRGTVSLVGRAADVRTGTYTVEVQVRDADDLPNGLVGRAEIAARSTGVAAMVPVDALLEADADSAVVYTVTESAPLTARANRVRVSQLVGDQAAITGLPDGARVITRGAPYVSSGAVVRIVSMSSGTMNADSALGGRKP